MSATVKPISSMVGSFVLSFFFCCTIEFFEEIAKFRVARKVYAKILKERFHAKNEKSLQLKFHTQTSGESLTAQQPDNNIVRVAMQTMAAVLGGTQSLHTNSMDETLALPSEKAAEIASPSLPAVSPSVPVKPNDSVPPPADIT
mgnify:CR=1 FL=1